VKLDKIENNSDLSLQLDWPFNKTDNCNFSKIAIIATTDSSQEYYFIPIGKLKKKIKRFFKI
jgi:hypothetical protein